MMNDTISLDLALEFLDTGVYRDEFEFMSECVSKEINSFSSFTESLEIVNEKVDFSKIKEKLKALWDKFKNFVKDIPNKIRTLVGKIKKFMTEKLQKIAEAAKKRKAVKEAAEDEASVDYDGEIEVTLYYYESTDKNGKNLDKKISIGKLTTSKFDNLMVDNKAKFLQNIVTTKAALRKSAKDLSKSIDKVEAYINEHEPAKLEVIEVDFKTHYSKDNALKIALDQSNKLLKHDLPALEKYSEVLKYMNETTLKTGMDVVNDTLVERYDEKDQQEVSTQLNRFTSIAISYISAWNRNVTNSIDGITKAGNYYLRLAMQCLK